MAPDRDTVHCANPDPEKQGTSIPRWKYELVRACILEELSDRPDGLTFTGLSARVRKRLDADQIDRLGSVSWHTTVVKLHLEAVAEIERLRRSGSDLVRLP